MSARDVLIQTACKRWAPITGTADADADAILAALSAAGYAVVPREPTEAMHDAARDWSMGKYGQGIGKDASDGCYLAMLAAAEEPQP